MEKNIFSLKKIPLVSSGETKPTSDKKVSASVGFILILLFVVSIIFGSIKKKKDDFKTRFDELSSTIEHNLNEAQSILLLNPSRAQELVSESNNLLSVFIEKNGNGAELGKIQEKIASAKENILGEYNVEPLSYVDFSLMFPDFQAHGLSVYKGQIYVFDKDFKRIIKVEMDKKRSEIVANQLPIDKRVLGIIPIPNSFYYLTEDGIYDNLGKVVIDGGWESEAIGIYFASNIYLVDKFASKIYRHSGSDGSFSEGVSWLKEGTEVNFGDVVAFSIDGYLWTMNQNGAVNKFSLGNKVRFTLKGVDLETFVPKDMYTDDLSDGIYFLTVDDGAEKIVAFDKTGNYKSTYIFGKNLEAVKITVSEPSKKAFVLTKDKLMHFDLKHLGK